MRRRIAVLANSPWLWLSLLLFWIAISDLRSWQTPWARVAATETLRWFVGIGLALALGYGFARMGRLAQWLTVGLGVLVTAVLFAGRGTEGFVTGPYHDHQLCASALLTLLPVSIALALASRHAKWRGAALTIAAAGTVCLALTGTRAAWAGAAVAAGVFLWLWLGRAISHGARPWGRILLPALLGLCLAGTFGLFVHGSGMDTLLSGRLSTLHELGRDGSWQWRLLAWHGALAMCMQHPWVGWGIGHYPAAHWRFMPLSHPLAPWQRPTLSDEAHNFYLQTLVDLGGIGLALYLAVLVSTARCVIRALRSARVGTQNSLRPALLIASLSLLAGQAVDALASPSWQFAEVSLLFWLCLGLALSAVRNARSDEAEASPMPAPLRRCLHYGAVGGAAFMLAGQAFAIGLLSPTEEYDQPNGWTLASLTIAGSTSSLVVPYLYQGTSTVAYVMTAVYQTVDAQGNKVSLSPITFTSEPGCSYTIKNTAGPVVTSTFSGNILKLSMADAPTYGKTNTFAITGKLTDTNGLHTTPIPAILVVTRSKN